MDDSIRRDMNTHEYKDAVRFPSPMFGHLHVMFVGLGKIDGPNLSGWVVMDTT